MTSGSEDPLNFSAAGRFASALAGFAMRRPAMTLVVLLALSLASVAAGGALLKVNTDSSDMLRASLDFQQRSKALNDAFPMLKNSAVIVVKSDIPDAADAAARELAHGLSDRTDAVERVFAAAVDPFFRANGMLYQSPEELEAELFRLNNAAAIISYLREHQNLPAFFKALYSAGKLATEAEIDPGALDRLYGRVAAHLEAHDAGHSLPFAWQAAMDDPAKDSRVTRLVLVTPKLDFSALQPARAVRSAIQEEIGRIDPETRAAVQIGVTGDPILRFEELKSVATGLELSLVLSLVLVAFLLLLCYRSIARALVTLGALFVTLALTTGFAAVAIGTLNLVSIAFVVLLVGLGLDFTIHVLLHVEESAHARPSALAVMETARSIGAALALSALTTSIAFLSFVATDFTGMAQLGVIGSAGVLIAFAVSLTFVPAVLALVPWVATARMWRPAPRTAAAARSVAERMRIPAAIAIMLVAAWGVTLVHAVRFDADPMKLRDPSTPSMIAFHSLNEDPDTTAYRLSLLQPDADAAIALAERVKGLPSVHDATTLASFVPKEQDRKLQMIDLAYPTLESLVEGEGLDLVTLKPGESELDALRRQLAAAPTGPGSRHLARALETYAANRTAQGANAYEADVFRYFPDLIDQFRAQLKVDEITLDNLPQGLVHRFVSDNGTWRVDVTPSGNMEDPEELGRFVDEVASVDPALTGPSLQIERAGEVVSRAMVQATLMAGFLVALISFLVVRRLTAVVAILAPLVVAGTLIAAASVLFAIPFNYANVIVLPLAIGLGVDSSIHLALRRSQLADTHTLFASSTPRAVVFSALTTIAAFASLMLSSHRGTASMGELLALAITITLGVALVVTPLLIDLFARRAVAPPPSQYRQT